MTDHTSIASSAASAVTSALSSVSEPNIFDKMLDSPVGQKILELQDLYVDLFSAVDFEDDKLRLAIFFVAFNPIYWNLVARMEYATKFLTKLAGGAKRGCYILAFSIFSLGIIRDYFFHEALKSQQTSDLLLSDNIKNVGYAIFVLGQILVITSMYQLGVTGTYLGDYFGILMDERVTAFPFNVSNNPMYHGSTLSFLGTALIYGKPAGIFVAFFVYSMYNTALKLEEPFTAKIYALRDEEKSKKKN